MRQYLTMANLAWKKVVVLVILTDERGKHEVGTSEQVIATRIKGFRIPAKRLLKSLRPSVLPVCKNLITRELLNKYVRNLVLKIFTKICLVISTFIQIGQF